MKICRVCLYGLALITSLVALPFASAYAATIQMLPPTDLSSTGVTNKVCGGGNALLSYSASTAQGTAGINCGSLTTDTAGGLALGNSGTLALGSSGLLNVPAGATADFGGTTQFTTPPNLSNGADFSGGTATFGSGSTAQFNNVPDFKKGFQADTSVTISGVTADATTISAANALAALLSTCNGTIQVSGGALTCGSSGASCTPTSQTQTAPCPGGQTGSISEQRDFSCPSGGGSGSWGSWYQTGNTCTTVSTGSTCSGSQTLYSGTCYANTQTCSVANGTGTQSFDSNTGSYGTCTASSCNSGYTLSGGQCGANAGSCTTSSGAAGTYDSTGTCVGNTGSCMTSSGAAGTYDSNGVCQPDTCTAGQTTKISKCNANNPWPPAVPWPGTQEVVTTTTCPNGALGQPSTSTSSGACVGTNAPGGVSFSSASAYQSALQSGAPWWDRTDSATTISNDVSACVNGRTASYCGLWACAGGLGYTASQTTYVGPMSWSCSP